MYVQMHDLSDKVASPVETRTFTVAKCNYTIWNIKLQWFPFNLGSIKSATTQYSRSSPVHSIYLNGRATQIYHILYFPMLFS